MERGTQIFWIVIIGIVLVQIIVNALVLPHIHKSVEYDFKAEVKQCESALENYNDKERDLINYERTNTDTMSIDNSYDFKNCRKKIANQDHYLKSDYIGFWVGVIAINMIIWFFVLLICGLGRIVTDV